MPSDIDEIASHWCNNLEKINTSFEVIGWERVKEIRLEDLKAAPVKLLSGICEFLGVRYSPEMLLFHQKNTELELEPREYLQWKEGTVEPLSQTEDRRYRAELNNVELERFESRAVSMLRRYNYPLEFRSIVGKRPAP